MLSDRPIRSEVRAGIDVVERAYAPSTEDSHQALWRRVNSWRQLRRNGRPYSPWSNHPERTNEVRARSLQSSVQITIRNRTEGSAVAIVTQSHAPRPPTSITASTASTIQYLNLTQPFGRAVTVTLTSCHLFKGGFRGGGSLISSLFFLLVVQR